MSMVAMATMRVLPSMTSTPGSLANRNNYLRAAEIINGRSAMVGFVAGAGKMILTGQSVLEQAYDPSQDLLPLLTMAAITAGTTISIADRLEMTEAPEPWTPGNELLNGRLAMMGMLALTFTL